MRALAATLLVATLVMVALRLNVHIDEPYTLITAPVWVPVVWLVLRIDRNRFCKWINNKRGKP